MRLTLLTLLAYLDDNLDPPDARELEKKIEESKFASDLVHRIRTCTRRLRLDAPKLDGKGMGLDPNTVSEFLDSTLPRDRFPDFEKVCLESDRHLAEVASCHQILTLVVDQPAQVPVGLRERIYRINAPGSESKWTRSAPGTAHPAIDGAEPLPPPKSLAVRQAAELVTPPPARTIASQPAPDLPDYLQPAGRSFWALALALVMVVLVVGGGWFAIGPGGNPLNWILQTGDDRSLAQNGNSANDSDSTSSANDLQVKEAPSDAGRSPENSLTEGSETDDTGSDDAPPMVDESGPLQGSGPLQSDDETVATGPQPPIDPAVIEETPSPSVPSPAENGKNGNDPAGGARPRAGVEVALLQSDDQVVAQFDPHSGLWQRLPRAATILSGERLVVLPTYRPIISLSNGIQMMLDGETAVQIQAPDEMGIPVVRLEHGHAVFNTAGKNELRVRLEIGGNSGIATFGGPTSELALEVQRVLPPGSEPIPERIQALAQWTVTMGSIDWESSEGESSSLMQGQMWIAATGQPTRVVDVDGRPSWLDRKSVSSLDQQASRELEGYLHSEKSLTLLLEERTSFRRVEVRSLAARCLGSLDEFGALLREISDNKQPAFWHVSVDAMRNALARSPESARKLQLEIQSSHSQDAKAIVRMLRDYDKEQFEAAGAKQLIEFLDHDSLIVRVIAFETLRRLTGSTHNYNPDRPNAERRKSIVVWNQRLKEKALVYRAANRGAP